MQKIMKNRSRAVLLLTISGTALMLSLLILCQGRLTVLGWMIAVDFQDHTCLGNHRIFLVNTGDRNPERGALFAFISRNTGYFRDGQMMVKIMAGLPGDSVDVTSSDTRVNGEITAHGLGAAEYAGADPKLFERSFTVPAGRYFMMGRSELSLDSRYYGTVNEEDLVGRTYILY